MSFFKFLFGLVSIVFHLQRFQISGSVMSQGFEYMKGVMEHIPTELRNPPKNKESSIEYRVYTPVHPRTSCILEPKLKALKKCPIDPEYLTVFLINGFTIQLYPGNLFEVLKDTMLQKGKYNIIIVDWGKYDKPPYTMAVINVHRIGKKIADLVTFLIKHAGIQAEKIMFVGHSLGAHMSGMVGKKIRARWGKKLARIDGIDPAWPLYETDMNKPLSYKDAQFVQIIHTSAEINGLGKHAAIGHMDFYVNGGKNQPCCKHGQTFQRPDGKTMKVTDGVSHRTCIHEIALNYYINTVNSTACVFKGVQCNNYSDFQKGKCPPNNSNVAKMGFNATKVQGFQPLSKFYLRTSDESPYCLEDGYLPM